MSIYSGVEETIRQAIAKGDFDNLPNKGKPLDLSEWKRTPEHLRMTYSILKNAGITPREVNLKKHIAEVKAEIKSLEKTTQQEERKALINTLNELMTTHNVKIDNLRNHQGSRR